MSVSCPFGCIPLAYIFWKGAWPLRLSWLGRWVWVISPPDLSPPGPKPPRDKSPRTGSYSFHVPLDERELKADQYRNSTNYITLAASRPSPEPHDKLQRVLNAAARVLTGTHKFDRGLSRLLHTELHWLDIPERVTYKLGVIMFGCQSTVELHSI